MKSIKVEVSDEEYEEILKRKGSKTHKQLILDSLNIDYERPQIGRPPNRAFSVEAYEQRAKAIYLDKLKKYNLDHANDVERIKKELGIDAKKGTTTPALGFDKKKRG